MTDVPAESMKKDSSEIKANTPGILTSITHFCVKPDTSLRDVIVCIDSNARGIALVVDDKQRLLGTITDGDVRRFILTGASLDRPASELLAGKNDPMYPQPTTAPARTSIAELLRIMHDRRVRQIPLLDRMGRVVALATEQDLQPDTDIPVQAIVMAGGRGTRLRPLTEKLPKPMLPVGGRPLMELVIGQLRKAGIRKVSVTTHYRAEAITSYFGDGSSHGVEINYVSEDKPLGTAGGIGLLAPSQDTLLVINGDILTSVDFTAMLEYHKEHKADLTVAVRNYEVEVPYGVVQSDGYRVKTIVEKPTYTYFVNAGIYLLESTVQGYVTGDAPMDMPDLIQRSLDENKLVVTFPIREYWLDIGEIANYEQAQRDEKQGRTRMK